MEELLHIERIMGTSDDLLGGKWLLCRVVLSKYLFRDFLFRREITDFHTSGLLRIYQKGNLVELHETIFSYMQNFLWDNFGVKTLENQYQKMYQVVEIQ